MRSRYTFKGGALALSIAFAFIAGAFSPAFSVFAQSGQPRSQAPDLSRWPEAAVYVVEPESGKVLFQQNADIPYPPFSVTKLLTASLVLDIMGEDATVTVTPGMLALVQPDSSLARIRASETFTVRQLLSAMLLASGNDAARAAGVAAGRVLAGNPGMKEAQAMEVFVAEMNEKAAAIGMENSVFLNPDGYPVDGMHSTARDMATLALHVSSNYPAIVEVAGSKGASVVTNSAVHAWSNTNAALFSSLDDYAYTSRTGPNPYYDPRNFGFKTGSGDKADGRSYAFLAGNGDFGIVGVLLHVPGDFGIFELAKTLNDWAFDSYATVSLVSQGQGSLDVPVVNSRLFATAAKHLVANGEASAFMMLSLYEDVSSELLPVLGTCVLLEEGGLYLQRSVAKGEAMLVRNYYLDGELLGSVTYLASENMHKVSYTMAVLILELAIGLLLVLALQVVRVQKGRAQSARRTGSPARNGQGRGGSRN